MTQDELDRALAAPLPAIADDGFSTAVSARLAAAQEWRASLVFTGLAAVAGMLLVFIPLDQVIATVESLAMDLGSSMPVAAAFAVLALCGTWLRAADAE